MDGGACGVINAGRSARDDDASRGPEFFQWSVAGEDLGRYAEIAYLPGNQMTVLAACIEDGDLRSMVYFFILSTTIL
jgi:hypothetical protein